MRILITGASGMLATQIIKDLKRGHSEIGELPASMKNAEILAHDADTLDITDNLACRAFFAENVPDICINCAAYTNVDGCEENSLEAFKVNAMGARNLARACELVGAKLVHISTDYVFSGSGSTPFCEYDLAAPQSVYGKTKLAGETFVEQFCSKYFVVRTAWLYGYNGKNFVKTITAAGKEKDELKVVDDQRGNPTNAADLSHHILKLAPTCEYGIYHCTGEGECSWYDFAKEIVALSGGKAKVLPCATGEIKRAAKRPEYSCLENMMLKATVGNDMRNWKVALKAYFENQE
ncbi:MAG: dTDP-4-dehydrorhamnose reductase [Oscillospiraceae bacterium]